MSNTVGAAVMLAYEFHKDQKQKDGSPYFAHVAEVAAVCAFYGGNEIEIAAAYLHDSIEDAKNEIQRAHRSLLIDYHSSEVLDIVNACTKPPKADKFRDLDKWQQRMYAYADQLIAGPDGTLLVAGSDKLVNARRTLADIEAHGIGIFDKFVSGKNKLWYHQLMAKTFDEHFPGPLSEELLQTVLKIGWYTDGRL